MTRFLAWFVPVRPTPGPSCLLILFVSGTLLALSVALALNEVSPT